MNICPHNPRFVLPSRGTEGAGGYDCTMLEPGRILPHETVMVDLGFSAEVPVGYVALLLPRSGAGAKYGVELGNTCGVIDSDYRGPWKAALRVKDGGTFGWVAGDKVVQFVIVPVITPDLVVVDMLNETRRGDGGFGSTGR